MKLPKDIVDKYREAMKEADKFGGQIASRVDHLICEVYPKAFDSFQISWYGFKGVNEYYDGDLYASLCKDSINIGEHELANCPDYRKQKEVNEVLQDCFPDIPIEYLFMDDQDILDEIEAEIQELISKNEAKKVKAKAAKVKREALKAEAIGKLSKEDRKILGL